MEIREVVCDGIDTSNRANRAVTRFGTRLALQQGLGIPPEWRARSDFDHSLDPRPNGPDLVALAWVFSQEIIRRCDAASERDESECRNCRR
jgi:hypothetical protein